MPVIVGKYAGFCYGVKAAVELAMTAVEEGAPCWILGDLIHNDQVMRELREAGLRVVESEACIESGTMIVRSHGMSPEVLERVAARGVRIVDATCPNVKRVHTLVASYGVDGGTVILAGRPEHPEIQATAGWCKGPVVVVENAESASRLYGIDRALVVAQTTLAPKVWNEIVTALTKRIPALTVANTICKATTDRQREAEELARDADVVLVVGGRESANTRALYDTCSAICPRTFHIESAAEIPLSAINASDYIAITAGASTPDGSLKEVATRMNDLENNIPQEQEAVEQTPVLVANEAPPVVTEEAPDTTETTPAQETAPMEAEAPQSKPAAVDPAENSFMADIEATLVSIRPGQTIVGTVVQITEDEICVNIGYKSDGIVKRSDLVTTDVVVNDKIEVEVVKVNDGEGNVVLSQRNIVNRRNWDALMAQYEESAYVDGVGKEAVKGGLIADVNGIRAFIPASQLSQRYVEKIEDFVGKEMKLKIIEVDKTKRRIVCSRKMVIIEEQATRKKEIWDKLQEGGLINGIVRRLTDFGAFVDIGGVDGLVHVTDLSWGRVRHPSDVVSPNQQITVKILSLDPERERIQLGYKQTQARPWDIAEEKYPAGAIVEGNVVRITTFGAFVELEPGLDGLVHISQCALTRIAKVEDAVEVGQIVRVKVLGVDIQAKRISLSIRAALEEEAFNYSSDIPGELTQDDMSQEYATPVDYSQYVEETVFEAQAAAEEAVAQQIVEEAAEQPIADAVEVFADDAAPAPEGDA